MSSPLGVLWSSCGLRSSVLVFSSRGGSTYLHFWASAVGIFLVAQEVNGFLILLCCSALDRVCVPFGAGLNLLYSYDGSPPGVVGSCLMTGTPGPLFTQRVPFWGGVGSLREGVVWCPSRDGRESGRERTYPYGLAYGLRPGFPGSDRGNPS